MELQKTIPPHIEVINNSYLTTSLDRQVVDIFFCTSDTHEDSPIGWPEYICEARSSDWLIYPRELVTLADMGIAFVWEYAMTSDLSYVAYNFPTEDSNNTLKWYKTNSKRGLPRMTKKMRLELENITAANELLYKLGIKNGTN